MIDHAVTATCTTTGLTEGKHCSVCNAVLIAQEIVAALGHDIIIDDAIAPTCTETGLTEGSHCSRCDNATVTQQVVDALGHIEVVTDAVPATHITTGLTEGKYCARCGKVLVDQEIIPMVEVPFKIELPSSLKVIKKEAFVDSAFECVIIPDGRA